METNGWVRRSFLGGVAASVCALAGLAAGFGPASGTIGTPITVDGAGFGEKPKASLRAEGLRSIPLKLTSKSDTQLVGAFSKGKPGVYDIVVKPKGADEIVFPGAFEVKLGEMTSVSPDLPLPKSAITIVGSLFGTKKGKVKVGGKPAKVTSWTDSQIVATLHKRTPAGAQALRITNKIGVVEIASAVDVADADAPTSRYTLGASLSNKGERFKETFRATNASTVNVVAAGTGYVVTATDGTLRSGDGTLVVDVSNATLTGTAETVHPIKVELTIDGDVWRAEGADIPIRIRRKPGGLESGEFDGTLTRVSGNGGPETIDVNGSYDVTIL